MRRCRLMLIRIGTLWWKKRPFRPGRRSVGRQLRGYAGRIGRLLPVSTKAVALIPKADPWPIWIRARNGCGLCRLATFAPCCQDRQNVVWGKQVSVRVDFG